MKNKILLLLLILMVTVNRGYTQDIVLNEIMSSNTTVISDEDGDYPDWIELYNRGTDNLNIQDWAISDSKDNLFKWVFPDITLDAGKFLVVFASDKDRRQWIPYWHTLIDWGDSWRYFPGTSQPPQNWNEQDFDDSVWQTGNSGFGYGDNDDATDFNALGLAPLYSVFIRKTFDIEDVQQVVSALLHIDYDDAFVAYLNGVEFARSNIGEAGVEPPYNQGADNYDHEARIFQGGRPEVFTVENLGDILVNGTNVLAIQVHNYDLGSSDMSCIPFFSIGLNYLPDDPESNPEILNLDSPGSLHCNFKIDADGETIYLTNSDSVLIDSVQPGKLPTDHSFGRQPDGSASWYYFDQSTPGSENINPGYLRFAGPPAFSIEGGFYNNSIELSLESKDSSLSIYYTLDGSVPDSLSFKYSQPITIDSTSVMRAVAQGTNTLPSLVITQNYLINQQSDLPVICLTTSPDNLWDSEYGIYVLGENYEDKVPYYGANFWQDWERPVHIEMFENDGSLAFSMDAGMKIHGGWSRARMQKSLAIFARNRYGASSINYALFKNRPFEQYQSFVLRNAANDWGRTMFTDGLIQTLAEPLDLEHQAYRPCVVYINGEYFSLLNIREKVNEDFIAMYHDVDPANLDILESNGSPVEGSSDHYDLMMDYISSHDMSLQENYDYIKTQMDIDNFIEYQAIQIYIDNRDWPGNNIKFWRSREENGRWRWILYDTEWGFGINAYGSAGNAFAYDYNTLQFASSPTPTPNHHGNPPWSTFLLRSLLENETFKHKFINRFADQMNTIFEKNHVLNVIDSLEANIENEIPYFFEKWRHSHWWYPYDILYWGSYEDWYYFNSIARDFAINRPTYMKQHIIAKFNLSTMANLVVDINGQGAGSIRVNSITASSYPWIGEYFTGIPIEITALAAPGYQFERWTGDLESESESLLFNFSSASSLTAHFKKISLPSTLVINEINYNSASDFDPEDWIEIFYDGDEQIDISGWFIQDEQDSNIFVLPPSTVLLPGSYYVLCRDTSAFKRQFPYVDNIIGNLNFGLSAAGDIVRLFTPQLELVDSVHFSNMSPWPTGADGSGSTIELKNPFLDNNLADSWAVSVGHGSPGAINSVYSSITSIKSENMPDQIFLNQNYPNPFNPRTTISYYLPQTGYVKLSVYNILGQETNVLVSGKISAGYQSLEFDASHLTSGVYFYRLEFNNQIVKLRKLVLIK